ncbi:MAG: hydrogenase formation protein HypD [Candidatus Aminicenantes bacterium]|nr:MAG: hydrogenase formation protein HypD [Candidatus Aminicenantes bacterium]
MKEFKDKKVIQALLAKIKNKTRSLPSSNRIMEVCGTHTMTVHRYGLKTMIEESGVEMVSGPGCPVCITPNEIHEAAIELITRRENFILTTFGDMTRVPTDKGSLQTTVPAPNSMVNIVYSPEESLEKARENPEKDVVFFGVGFETTIPAITMSVKEAHEEGLPNYSVLSALWLIPPPLKAIVDTKEIAIDGFLYPGHVSAIIGEKPYRFIAEEYGIPGAITGFEPSDMLLGILSILEQIEKGKAEVANAYSRVVRASGNTKALALMKEMLEIKDAHWRGLGLIPRSGLRLKKKYSAFDAEIKYNLKIKGGSGDLPGCRCGEVLQGLASPPQCTLFAKTCNPDSPYGPCMVSFEGACLIYYKYQRSHKD